MTPEPRRERKVISVAFADLVGFTARSDNLDPEDVEAFLRPYHEQLKGDFERFGGTVEKFIGDAVVAIFGAPIAHEDDAERAVRAALAIRDRTVEQGDLRIRIAVTTGEAIVRLDAAPERGEALATGEVLNTASRLQSVAPENTVLIDQRTHDAVHDVIEDQPAAPVDVKGKATPVAVWTAIEARSRFGVDVRQSTRTPLVGRDLERSILLDTLARVEADRSPQLVTLIGVPGIGKSRLVYELFAEIERQPELRYWRQGRSLPYGEGVSLWALAEMIKAQAGVLEGDDDTAVAAKLAASVGEVLPDDEVDWVVSSLRPLVGLEGAAEGMRARREEAFTAWRRFFEGLAERHTLVLVFEDVHWADDALLDFIEHLVDWASDVPILVVCTARPELLERRAGWSGGKANALTLRLSPLSDADSTRLLSLVLGSPVLAAETQQSLLERASGNPLFAEQFARLLQERGPAGDLTVPHTIHGLIAARLDTLSPDEKALIGGASIMGKVFWSSALPEMTDRDALLHGLERKEFIRRERRSSVAGQDEYAFRHVLVRDVAYGQIPRSDRAARHLETAAWIEALGRPQDHAELVAHHYRSAMELSGAPLPPAAVERARSALIEAGERAFALSSFSSAAGYYREALELLAPDDPRRPRTLFGLGFALFRSTGEGEPELAAASDALVAAGDIETAAEAECRLTTIWWERGFRDRWWPHLERAQALVRERPPSPSKAFVLASRARYLYLTGDATNSRPAADEALAMAESLGLDEFRAHALNTIALGRSVADPDGGYTAMRESIAIATARNSIETYYGYNNLSVMLEAVGRTAEAFAAVQESHRVALRFGAAANLRWARFTETYWMYAHGEWDEALQAIDRLMGDPALPPGHYLTVGATLRRGLMLAARGESARPREDIEFSVGRSRASLDPQQIIPALASGAFVLLLIGDESGARAYVEELFAIPDEQFLPITGALSAPSLAAVSHFGRGIEYLARFTRHRTTLWTEAGAKAVAGEWAAAADAYESMELRSDEALARVLAAEDLAAAGRRTEADHQLERALRFYRSVGALRFIRRAQDLVGASA